MVELWSTDVMLWLCALDVSSYVARGRAIEPPSPLCPRCGGPTGPWAGYLRYLRTGSEQRIFVPRVRCRRCGLTQALLPWFVLPYRPDPVDVVGEAWVRSAAGQGVRRIAVALGRPETTVREWCRRFRKVAGVLASFLLAEAVHLGWSGWELPVEALARCLAAVEALRLAWSRRHGPVSGWCLANLVTGGGLLGRNRPSPLAPRRASGVISGIRTREVSDGP